MAQIVGLARASRASSNCWVLSNSARTSPVLTRVPVGTMRVNVSLPDGPRMRGPVHWHVNGANRPGGADARSVLSGKRQTQEERGASFSLQDRL